MKRIHLISVILATSLAAMAQEPTEQYWLGHKRVAPNQHSFFDRQNLRLQWE
jgi:hypothetical protein